MTQRELDERIMSQLMEHKLLIDERETEKGTKKERTLKPITLKSTLRTDAPSPPLPTAEDIDTELRQRLAMRRQELEQEWKVEQEVIQRQLERERLLKRRETLEENTLKKSVSFKGVEDLEGLTVIL